MSLKNVGTVIFVSFIHTFAFSQQMTDTVSEIKIETTRLQISANQSGRNITIIDEKTIQALPVKSIAELLSYAAGMDIRQRGPWGSQADISIQGGTFDQSLLLIDGVRLSDPQTGHNQLNIPIPLETIERIEILKGPAARVYGVNSIAGAINIVTKNPKGLEVISRLYTGSSFQKDTSNGKTYLSYGGGISVGFIAGKVSQIISTGWDVGNGYRYNTGFSNSRYFSKTKITITPNQTLTFAAGYTYNRFGANGFYAAPGDKESMETVQNTIAVLQYELQQKKWRFLPRFSYRYNFDDYIYKRQNPSLYRNRHFTNVYNGEINASRQLSIGQIGFGVEYRKDDINSNNLGQRNREVYGISADIMITKIKNFTITGGLYAMQHSVYGLKVFPGLEIAYRTDSKSTLFANAGSAQRLPTYTDLYYKGPSNIANPNLIPENSMSGEIGYRKKMNWIQVQGSVFLRDINNLIDWVKDSATAPWSPINYNTSRTIGAEIATTYLPFINQKNKMLSSLKINASYTYLKPDFISENPKNLSKNAVEILAHQALFNIQTELFTGLNLSLGMRYLKRTNMNQYLVTDLRIQYNLKKFAIFADATNIGNTQYSEITTVPMVPRWIAVGLKL